MSGSCARVSLAPRLNWSPNVPSLHVSLQPSTLQQASTWQAGFSSVQRMIATVDSVYLGSKSPHGSIERHPPSDQKSTVTGNLLKRGIGIALRSIRVLRTAPQSSQELSFIPSGIKCCE
ncbi:hypothetical protein CRG98_018073 [Punica granatum]|uniref:Uncharacterized protein n=1 Tax=Punica granatum TaxID=22663 RepID=A0A2I0JZ29_PUNGR|nr:hypothetical protein CRG98_018073 [Punica granatum]